MQEYAGLPRRKRSANKATWPGRKQVWRRYGADGRMAGDLLGARRATTKAGEPLIELVMQNGRRVAAVAVARRDPAPRQARAGAAAGSPCAGSKPGTTYPVEVADELVKLAAEVDRRVQEKAPASCTAMSESSASG